MFEHLQDQQQQENKEKHKNRRKLGFDDCVDDYHCQKYWTHDLIMLC
jgi:hypothetical protein